MTRQDELNEAWCKYMGKCSTEIIQALAFALRWCDEHPQWISVEDELPEETQWVLVYGATSELAPIDTSYFDSKSTWEELGVTHWMPLPETPKKGGEE